MLSSCRSKQENNHIVYATLSLNMIWLLLCTATWTSNLLLSSAAQGFPLPLRGENRFN
jgi:hypothetical protein